MSTVQRRFVFVRMNRNTDDGSSRPGWWHLSRKVPKSPAVAEVMDQFRYGSHIEVETTDEIAAELLKWAAGIPGWKNQLTVEVWENGKKVTA